MSIIRQRRLPTRTDLEDRPAGIPACQGYERLVVIIVPDFFPTLGGTVRQAYNNAAGFAESSSLRPTVMARRYSRSLPRQEKYEAVPVRRFGLPGRSMVAEKLALLSLLGWLWRRRKDISLVQTIMYPDYAVVARLAGLGRRTQVLWAISGEAAETVGPARSALRGLQHLVRRNALRASTQIALTEAMREEIEGAGLSCTSVVPVAVDEARFHRPSTAERSGARRRLGFSDSECVVVYTGRFAPVKGLAQLVEAFASVQSSRSDVRLMLVGGGDDREVLEAMARLHVQAGVLLPGVVTDVERYLWAADVFVLPSAREGLSNSLAEAMCCGLACVATAGAQGAEVLYGPAGIVLPSAAPAELARAIGDLADDASLREQLGHAALERARMFSRASVVARYLEAQGLASLGAQCPGSSIAG